MTDPVLFKKTDIGKVYEKLFTTEEQHCAWLLGCLTTMIKEAPTEKIQEGYAEAFNEALQWKARLNAQGKIVHPMKNWQEFDTLTF